jgi:dTDP-glucose pyrophosphorylase
MDLQSLNKVTLIIPANVKDAVIKLNNSGLKILCVVNKNNKLLGTISDGDIRRSLLKNIKLTETVEKVLNKKPITIYEDKDFLKVNEILNKNKISGIPVIDKNNKLKDLITTLNNQSLKNIIYIVAGGRGKRMMPLTEENPKPLLNYMGEPIIKKLINKIKEDNFKNIIISINYLGHKIENYFKKGKKFGLNIKYIKENKELGTAGSFYELNKLKSNLPVLVTNADLVTNLKFRDILNFHNHNHADITMAIKKHEYQNPFGVIGSKGIVLKKIVEKPIMNFNINAGVYVINKKLFKIIKKNEYFDIPEFINFYLKKKKKIIIFPLHEDWKDVQQPKDLM